MALFFWVRPLTTLDWVTTAGYAVTGMLCLRALVRRQNRGIFRCERSLWLSVAGVAVALGVNKQFKLQTLLIVTGGKLAMLYGWDDAPRVIQKVFFVIMLIAAVVITSQVLYRHIDFFKRYRALGIGLGLTVLYCLLRAADINHVELLGSGHSGHESLWPLELSGITLMIFGAARAGNKPWLVRDLRDPVGCAR